jgi:5-methylcytosine-specific restriction endonuclease McrA
VDALVYRNSDKEQRAEVAYKWRTTVGLEATRESARRNYQNNKEWYRDREYRERLLMKEAFVESIDKDTVYKRDQGVCQICDQHVDDELVWPHPESPSLDHIFPISLGGEHSYRNIQLTHLECNLSKNNKV